MFDIPTPHPPNTLNSAEFHSLHVFAIDPFKFEPVQYIEPLRRKLSILPSNNLDQFELIGFVVLFALIKLHDAFELILCLVGISLISLLISVDTNAQVSPGLHLPAGAAVTHF